MKVFISYAHEDSLLSDHIAKSLEEIGVEVSRDKNKTRIAENLYKPLQEEIESADLVILIATKASAPSRPVAGELGSASALHKTIIPLLAEGCSLADFAPLDSGIKYIHYDASRYDDALHELIRDIRGRLEPQRGGEEVSSRRRAVSLPAKTMLNLRWEQITDLLLLDPDVIAPLLEERLIESAHAVTRAFFHDPKYRTLVNLGTLSTDAKDVVVLRHDTLHALLRASAHPKWMSFRTAGCEAGVMYGVGVVKWLLSRSSELYGHKGLPEDPIDLLRTCVEIDKSSGWGAVELAGIEESFDPGGWDFRVEVSDHFLHTADPDREALYRGFWSGYLSGTFSSALLAWYGERRPHIHEVPFYIAFIDQEESTQNEITLQVRLRPPSYSETCISLYRDLLCPYVREEVAIIPKAARAVVESFVREVAGQGKGGSDSRENVVRAVSWLAQNGPTDCRKAASHLQTVRNQLHKYVHESNELATPQTLHILRTVVAAVLMGCQDLQLLPEDVEQLRAALAADE